MTQEPMEYLFTVEGGFDVSQRLAPRLDSMGRICGFVSPEGDEYTLAVCLRRESADGKESWHVSENAMSRHGFSSLDYKCSDWEVSQ